MIDYILFFVVCVFNSLTNMALYSSATKLKFPMLLLFEEYKLGKVTFGTH